LPARVRALYRLSDADGEAELGLASLDFHGGEFP
jgi:hypothetical protein